MKTLTQQLQILSQKRFQISNYKITNQWLVGFIEAEGSFICSEGQQPYLHLSQHTADWTLMRAIASFLEDGKLRIQTRTDGRSEAILTIHNKDTLKNKIIPMCMGNLRSVKKQTQFVNWITSLLGITDTQVPRINPKIDTDWLVGFTDGDGSFYPMLHKSKDYKCGYQVQATFDLAQHELERELLNHIGNQLCNGEHKWAKSGNTQHMRVLKLSTHITYIEPFFNANPLQSRKQFDFLIWQEKPYGLKSKKHLTEDGITYIKELQALQNQYRLAVPEISLA